MDLEIYQVDSFTTQAFKGNPAGGCISQKPLEESLMYSMAAREKHKVLGTDKGTVTIWLAVFDS